MRRTIVWIFVLLSSATSACERSGSASVREVAGVARALLGAPLPGVEAADFEAAKAAFVSVEEPEDGIGPIFNDTACGNCHTAGAIGGASEIVERRFGRLRPDGTFDPLANRGGSLRQLKALGPWKSGCNVPLETEPRDSDLSGLVHNAGRLTTPLFGLGLVDAMPDAFFVSLAAAEPAEVAGTISGVSVRLPDPNDPTQSVGSARVGRFGWKAAVPTLLQFAADAYVNEMGITTRSCIQGSPVDAFAVESAPDGEAVDPNCEDGLPGIDEAVECTGDPLQNEIQEDVAEFAEFMTFLAPPARERDNSELEVADSFAAPGRKLFDSFGCAGCHTRQAFVTPASPSNGVPGGMKFWPFSDFLLHDMGALGDRIGNLGEREAQTRLMRTAPLWGIRFRPLLLHDGRARDISGAINAHDGQAASARNAFQLASAKDQQALLDFVISL